MIKNSNLVLRVIAVVLIFNLIFSCKSHSIIHRDQLQPITIGLVSFWNIKNVNAAIWINETKIYSNHNLVTVTDHLENAISFFKRDSMLYANGDTLIPIQNVFLLKTKMNNVERLDTININESKQVVIQYGIEDNEEIIVLNKLDYIKASR